ncbi:MAG TPA: hypothetical protein VGN24_08535 [Rhodanobacter sp.]|jgi:hypothetical protein|nr:hypothetical protein [Rhodanobacter sp.]
MNHRLSAIAALTAIGLSMTLCFNAKACGIGDLTAGPASLLSTGPSAPLAMSATDALQQVVPGMTNALQEQQPITGLYRFTFTAKGDQGIPDGTLIDQGFATWHADGTEIMNSGRPPITGSFCMGVWARTGPQTYRLNHWAMSWDPTGKTYIGPTNIREYIQLDRRGNSYSGDFTLTQYAPDGKTQLGGVKGVVAATRVTDRN